MSITYTGQKHGKDVGQDWCYGLPDMENLCSVYMLYSGV